MTANFESTAGLAPAIPAAPPSRWRVWFQAIRIFSFTASVVPILVATALAMADGAFADGRVGPPLLVAAMLVASVACHAGANLANDYYDHARGIDTAESLGPSKVIQQGLLTPAEVRRGMVVAFAVATVVGLGIVAISGWRVLALALVSLAVAYLYTGGPKPFGYVALGEVAVFLAMGLGMVVGAYYVLTDEVSLASALAAVAVGGLVTAILHANNVRDVDLDRAAGKTTLATLLGRRAANLEYAFLIGLAYVATAALVASEPRLWPALVVLATAPRAVWLVRLIWRADSPRVLNVALRRTAGLHLRFGLLLTGGLVVGAILDGRV